MENQDQKHRPPQWVLRFLRWFCSESFHEEIEGDLYELFYDQVEAIGYQRAKQQFFLYIFPYLRPYFWGNKPISIFHFLPTKSMILNYLKVAWRNARHQQAFTLISLLGLATGMIALLFIGEYVRFEKSYDDFHGKGDQLYRLRAEGWHNDGRKWFQATTNFPVAGPQTVEKVPKSWTLPDCFHWKLSCIHKGRKQNPATKKWTSSMQNSAFLRMFSFPLLHGDVQTALKDQTPWS